MFISVISYGLQVLFILELLAGANGSDPSSNATTILSTTTPESISPIITSKQQNVTRGILHNLNKLKAVFAYKQSLDKINEQKRLLQKDVASIISSIMIPTHQQEELSLLFKKKRSADLATASSKPSSFSHYSSASSNSRVCIKF